MQISLITKMTKYQIYLIYYITDIEEFNISNIWILHSQDGHCHEENTHKLALSFQTMLLSISTGMAATSLQMFCFSSVVVWGF